MKCKEGQRVLLMGTAENITKGFSGNEAEIVYVDVMDPSTPYLVYVAGADGHSGSSCLEAYATVLQKGYVNHCRWVGPQDIAKILDA